eukprot:CAMPEP_0194747058 /NCGR_PEP_ID=MMETSP0323_2-20130528/1122_1 /TAXON_ID=2866 ORGANISM="Crypthecodinium cohnii, Strain Seligo" /NCGR_SAMPLE_ID=MMETSP0323_2 /ASSEMBLY_ACC=CAM_ASM_000346 /LENGTH=79 /DNA_ID=CAMNT_0039660063 /DNA_START=51 /DNA_END=287 /DNA_ORIENTATION=-
MGVTYLILQRRSLVVQIPEQKTKKENKMKEASRMQRQGKVLETQHPAVHQRAKAFRVLNKGGQWHRQASESSRCIGVFQ